MAARVTATEVKTLIETDLLDAAVVNQIAMATALTDRVAAKDATISAAILKLIEMNLAAHFIATSLDPRTQSEGASGTSTTNEGRFAESRYWANALKLDTTGTLKASEAGAPGVAIVGAF